MESADPIECEIELTGSEDEDDTSRHYERYNSIREKLLYNLSKLQQRGPFMTAGMIGGSNIDPGLHVRRQREGADTIRQGVRQEI